MRKVLGLLKLSGLVINPNKSWDYWLFLLTINIGIVLLGYLLNLQIQYVFLLASFLLCQAIITCRSRLPHPELESVSYNGRNWTLKFKNGDVDNYQRIKIRLDAGFFSVIAFYKQRKFKNIILFNDQLTPVERRIIFVLEKVSNKT